MAYIVPTAADLKARYPAFDGVADATINIYIADAQVDTTWLEADYATAICAFAAHQMALLGIGAQSEVEKYARAGVTGIKTGNFDVNLSSDKVAAASGGGLEATLYGRQYQIMLKRNRGGPRVVVADAGSGGTLPWNY